MRKLFLFFSAFIGIFAVFCFFLLFGNGKTAVTAPEYTGGELRLLGEELGKEIGKISGSELSGNSLTCYRELLGVSCKTVYYFDKDGIITKIVFTFPPELSLTDGANRINEQLGEATLEKYYENGSAVFQWQRDKRLFTLTCDGKISTLTVAKFYGNEH